MQRVTAMFVATLEHSDLQSANWGVGIQPKDGTILYMTCTLLRLKHHNKI